MATLSDELRATLREALPPDTVSYDPSDLDQYNHPTAHQFTGYVRLRPELLRDNL